MKNEFILRKYHEVWGFVYDPSNNDEELLAEVPEGWWVNHSKTQMLLAALVHRSNPDVAADPTEIAAGLVLLCVLMSAATLWQGERGTGFLRIMERSGNVQRIQWWHPRRS